MLSRRKRAFKAVRHGIVTIWVPRWRKPGAFMQKWLNRALLLAGGMFSLTAMLYVVMMVRADRASRAPAENLAGSGLDRLIHEYGQTALIVELAVLAVLVGLVIWQDEKKAPHERS
jgi:hypothetical protein